MSTEKIQKVIIRETLFECFNDDLFDANKSVFLFLDDLISKEDYEEINEFINDDRIVNLHPSLLQSMLIMVENLEGQFNISTTKLQESFKKQCEIFDKKEEND